MSDGEGDWLPGHPWPGASAPEPAGRFRSWMHTRCSSERAESLTKELLAELEHLALMERSR